MITSNPGSRIVAALFCYAYDGLNRRIKKTVDNVVTRSFFNFNWQELESRTDEDVTTYVWGLRYVDDLVSREKDDVRLYALQDANWNVVALTDVDGAVVERYTYDGFGKRNALMNSGIDFDRAFTGQVLDEVTGLMCYRNRYYSASLGRFVTRDPIGYDAGDPNLYRYVENMPIRYFDQFGFQKSDWVVDGHVARQPGYVNCLGAATGQDLATAPATNSSMAMAMEQLGYNCTQNISAADCEAHCNEQDECTEYVMVYIDIVNHDVFREYMLWNAEYFGGDWWNATTYDQTQQPGYHVRRSDGSIGIAPPVDFHAIRGAGGGCYVQQPSRQIKGGAHDYSNNMIYTKTLNIGREQINMPYNESTPDYFPEDRILAKACCCK